MLDSCHSTAKLNDKIMEIFEIKLHVHSVKISRKVSIDCQTIIKHMKKTGNTKKVSVLGATWIN